MNSFGQSVPALGAALAIIVLFLFLRTFGASAVVSVAIPVCAFATALGMQALGMQAVGMHAVGMHDVGVGALDIERVQLQGIPLAIELAAAWVEVMPPAEVAAEIERCLDFLESDWVDVPERQRSIRAVFEHSWNLLSPRERVAFQELSVFRGGFGRQAAGQGGRMQGGVPVDPLGFVCRAMRGEGDGVHGQAVQGPLHEALGVVGVESGRLQDVALFGRQDQLAALKQEITRQVRFAVRALEDGAAAIDAAVASRRLAVRNLEAEQTKFNNGLSTNFQVAQIQDALATAQLSEIRARVDYRKALAADDGFAAARLALIKLELSRGNRAAAIAEAKKAAADMPTSPEIQYLLGEMAARQNDYVAALGYLERAMKGMPGNADGWALLGHAYQANTRVSDAAEAYGKAVELDSKRTEWLRPLAEVQTDAEAYKMDFMELLVAQIRKSKAMDWLLHHVEMVDHEPHRRRAGQRGRDRPAVVGGRGQRRGLRCRRLLRRADDGSADRARRHGRRRPRRRPHVGPGLRDG